MLLPGHLRMGRFVASRSRLAKLPALAFRVFLEGPLFVGGTDAHEHLPHTPTAVRAVSHVGDGKCDAPRL